MTCSKGDIVIVRFPNNDLVTYKHRPALVVQSDTLTTGYDQKLVACITSNVRKRAAHRIFVDINNDEGKETGLLADSVIVTDNLATVKEREIHKVIGSLSDIQLLNASLRTVFSI
ncbi:MAG: type II toxin-antitoxin system PemK/MazF family toxin [Candidatus Cloacimonetes bacterium]|nr:type II toxin-antitoxin system PemK/MazF family toxin [Candidatus Cloacimonadota bacterium]